MARPCYSSKPRLTLAVFAGMLNEMRLGKLCAQSVAIFKGLDRPIHYDDDVDATELCVPCPSPSERPLTEAQVSHSR